MTFSYARLPGVHKRCERLQFLFYVLLPYKSRVRYGGRYKELNICRTSKNNPIPLLVLTLVIKMSANCFAMFSNFNLFQYYQKALRKFQPHGMDGETITSNFMSRKLLLFMRQEIQIEDGKEMQYLHNYLSVQVRYCQI